MLFVHLIFALFFAILLSAIFALGFSRKGPGESVALFFLLLFLLSWAGGAWLAPFGPQLWGGYWLPFLLVGVVIALFLAALAPTPQEPGTNLAKEGGEAVERQAALSGLGIFFWILMATLVAAIVIRYI
ncbi:MAG: hypothetical protein K9N21_06645 [Deltaproteobacteria bacterium]|nr:hypothetical protein [Deltaproteobacteria bacterium]